MVPHEETTKESSKTQQNKENEFIKITRYDFHAQKLITFLHTSNELTESEILKKNSTQNSIERNKILRNKFNKKSITCNLKL